MRKKGREKKEIVIEVDLRRVGFMLITILLCLLALVTLFKFACGFLRIKSFEAEGVSVYYSVAQLAAAAELNYGDLLYSTDTSGAERLILERCVYMESVNIKRVFPGKIVFEVEEKSPQWYIEITGDFYALDMDLTVLEESTDEARFKDRGLTRITLPNVKSAVCGELIYFGADESEIKYAARLISELCTHPLKPRITVADIDNRFDIYITVDGNYEAHFGDRSNMKSKLDALEKILTPDFKEKYPRATIDVRDPSTVGVKTG